MFIYFSCRRWVNAASRLLNILSLPGKLLLLLIIIPISVSVQAIDNITEGQVITVPGDEDSPATALNFLINGTLNIGVSGGDTGIVNSFSGIIATSTGSEGHVVVTGEGSQWTNDAFLYVGHTGNGTLLIRDGGLVSNLSTGYIGYNALSSGRVEVTGPGSTWDTANRLDIGLGIGRSGAGTLIVADGGIVNSGRVLLGQNTGSDGVLIIGGEPSRAPGRIVGDQIAVGEGSGTLILNHNATDYVFDSTLNDGQDNPEGSGTGLAGNILIEAFNGRTLFNSDHGDFTGLMQAQDNGVISVNGDMSGATVSLLPGGTLEGTGRVGNTTNAGTISSGQSIGTLTVDGDYHGNGGRVLMESVLGGDDSPADRLNITGSASGNTTVEIVNLGGEGGFTENGIPLIFAAQSSDGDAFKLHGDFTTPEGEQAVVHGAFAYAFRMLEYGQGRWWYLTSDLADPQSPVAPVPEVPDPGTPEPGPVTPGVPVFPVIPETPDENVPQRYHPGAALYEQYPQILAELNRVPTLQQRVGDRYWVDESARQTQGAPGSWARIEGTRTHSEPVSSTTDAQRTTHIWKLQTGVDVPVHENQHGLLTGGVNFSYGRADADIRADSGKGSINTTGYGPGLTLTWYDNSGFYVDGQLQMMFFDSDLDSDTVGNPLTSSNKGKGYAGSVETGWRLDSGTGFAVTPQAQLIWSRVDFDSFEDTFGSKVSLSEGNSLLARLGVSADRRDEWQAQDKTQTRSTLQLTLDVYQELGNGTSVDVAEVNFASRDARTQIAAGVGGRLAWNDGRYEVYGNLGVQASPHNPSDNYGAGGNIGVRVNW